MYVYVYMYICIYVYMYDTTLKNTKNIKLLTIIVIITYPFDTKLLNF